MNKKGKIETLQSLLKGTIALADLKQRPLVSFVELITTDNSPSIYLDRSGNRYSEEQKQDLITRQRQESEIVFVEVKTYNELPNA